MTERSKKSYFIYFVVFAVNIATFSAGGCFSWTSPILPKLKNLDPEINPLLRPISTLEESWIAAISNLGAAIGPLIAGFFTQTFGKKTALLIMIVPVLLSHILCAFAKNVLFILIARFLIGCSAGSIFGIVPSYVSDISEDTKRGLFGSMLGVFNSSGMLFMYVVGPFLSVRLFSLINLIAPVIFYILFGLFAPQSPYDLIRKGEKEKAEISLRKLRGASFDQSVQEELELIIKSIGNNSTNSRLHTSFVNLFKEKFLMRAMIISNSLLFLQQFSGICTVLAYMQIIFDTAKSSISPEYAVILIGSVQLIANFISSQLVEKAGRRILIIISLIFSSLSLIVLGAYFLLLSINFNLSLVNWLPIASLICYMIMYNLGLANLPWIYLAELFPANFKAISATISTSFCFSIAFFITICFPYASKFLGMTAIFWIFAGVLLCGLLFTYWMVPETKGKSSEEIKKLLLK